MVSSAWKEFSNFNRLEMIGKPTYHVLLSGHLLDVVVDELELRGHVNKVRAHQIEEQDHRHDGTRVDQRIVRLV